MGQSELDKKRTSEEASSLFLNRRGFIGVAAGTAFVAGLHGIPAFADVTGLPVNLAKVAIPSSFMVTSENKISALNDGFEPANSRDRQHGSYAIRTSDEVAGAPWIEYGWSKPVAINKVEIFWAIDAPRPKGFAGSEGGAVEGSRELPSSLLDGHRVRSNSKASRPGCCP